MDHQNNVSVNGTTGNDNSIILEVFYWERIIVCVAVGLIAMAGITGNLMIIFAVAFSRTLQTATNAFVLSLSVADLMTSFSLIWIIVSLVDENGWPLPNA